ncbi:MAG TPA: hypothetical protein VGC26_06950 [Afipia sp.]
MDYAPCFIVLGTFTIRKVVGDSAPEEKKLLFQLGLVIDGIDPSDDPLIQAVTMLTPYLFRAGAAKFVQSLLCEPAKRFMMSNTRPFTCHVPDGISRYLRTHRRMQSLILYAALCFLGICQTITPLAAQQDTADARQACTPDVFRLCSEFIPDADRITFCLQQQKRNLSAGCRKVFAARPVRAGAER